MVVENRLDIEDVSVAYVQCYEFFNPFVSRFRKKLNEDFVSTYFSLREHRGFFESLLRIIEHHGERCFLRLTNVRVTIEN